MAGAEKGGKGVSVALQSRRATAVVTPMDRGRRALSPRSTSRRRTAVEQGAQALPHCIPAFEGNDPSRLELLRRADLPNATDEARRTCTFAAFLAKAAWP